MISGFVGKMHGGHRKNHSQHICYMQEFAITADEFSIEFLEHDQANLLLSEFDVSRGSKYHGVAVFVNHQTFAVNALPC